MTKAGSNCVKLPYKIPEDEEEEIQEVRLGKRLARIAALLSELDGSLLSGKDVFTLLLTGQ